MTESIQPLRATIPEAAAALRISRALLYQRIQAGEINCQHDGKRAFITFQELKRYVAARDSMAPAPAA
jgi:excisionase family DNA binding protein